MLRDITTNWGKLQYAEILRPNALVKPFFDCEIYLTSQPTEAELQGILESQATAIGKQKKTKKRRQPTTNIILQAT